MRDEGVFLLRNTAATLPNTAVLRIPPILRRYLNLLTSMESNFRFPYPVRIYERSMGHRCRRFVDTCTTSLGKRRDKEEIENALLA